MPMQSNCTVSVKTIKSFQYEYQLL
uniref:Uncharacterized protein n=1 Tax=Anguilla anguilla TaxID=7936 RepID=A0A0E9R770_ANGAN